MGDADDDGDDQHDDGGGAESKREPVAADEFADAVGAGGRGGFDGFAGEVAFEIAHHSVDRFIAAGALLFEGFEGDPIEFAVEEGSAVAEGGGDGFVVADAFEE